MTLYRAQYATRSGTVRRMTIAASSIKEAQRIAAQWELRDDKLQSVCTIRELSRAAFQLTLSEVM